MEGLPDPLQETKTIPANPVSPRKQGEFPTAQAIQPKTTRETILNCLNDITVSNFCDYIPVLRSLLKQECTDFQAGRLKRLIPEWEKLTNDSEILSKIQGDKIEFDYCPEQNGLRKETFSRKEIPIIKEDTKTLLSKGVLQSITLCQGENISTYFCVRNQTERIMSFLISKNLTNLSHIIILKWIL